MDLDLDLDFDVDLDEVAAQVSEALGLNGAPLIPSTSKSRSRSMSRSKIPAFCSPLFLQKVCGIRRDAGGPGNRPVGTPIKAEFLFPMNGDAAAARALR